MVTAAEINIQIEAKNRAEAELRKLLGSMKAVEKQGESTSSAFSKLGGTITTVGKVAAAAATGGVLALGAGIAGTIKTAATFQQSLANVGAATGATKEQMAAMRAEALKIGADTSKGASEAVEAMGELTKSGIAVNDVVGGVGRTVVQLAEATGSSVANMATLISDSMNIFKVSAADSAAAANVLAKAAGASSITIDDMAQSLSQGGLVAKSAGLSIDQFATAIGIMGNQGLKASDAGTSLRSFIAGLTPSSKEATKAFSSMGIQVFDASGKFRAFPDILASLGTAFGKLTEQQRAQTAELLFGSDGIRAFNALVPDTTKGLADATTQWTAFGTEMGKAPSIAEQSAARLATLSGTFEQLKGSLETIAIEIGSVFLPILTRAVGWIATNLPGAFEAARAKVGDLIATVRELAGGVWERVGPTVQGAASTIQTALSGVVTWVGDNWPKIKGVIIDAFQDVDGKIGQALEAIRSAVAGIKIWIDENWPAIKATIIDAFQDTEGKIGQSLAAIQEASRSTSETIKEHWPSVKTAIVSAFEEAQDPATRALNHLGEEGKRWGEFFSTEWPALINAGIRLAESLFPGLTATVVGFVAVTRGGAEEIGAAFGRGVGGAIEGVTNLATGFSQTLLGILGTVTGFLTRDWQLAWEGAKTVAGGLAQILSNLGGPLGVAAQLLQGAASNAQALAGGIRAVINNAGDALAPLGRLADALGGVAGKLPGLGDIIKRSPVPLAEGIREVGTASKQTFPWVHQLGDEFGSMSKQTRALTVEVPQVGRAIAAVSDPAKQLKIDIAGLDVAIARLRVQLTHTEAYSAERAEIEKQIQFLEGWRSQLTAVQEAEAAVQRQLELTSVAMVARRKVEGGLGPIRREEERERLRREAETERRRLQSVDLDRIREDNRRIQDEREKAARELEVLQKELAAADAERARIMALPGGTSPMPSIEPGHGMAAAAITDFAWYSAMVNQMASGVGGKAQDYAAGGAGMNRVLTGDVARIAALQSGMGEGMAPQTIASAPTIESGLQFVGSLLAEIRDELRRRGPSLSTVY